jgi:hypothetical protein
LGNEAGEPVLSCLNLHFHPVNYGVSDSGFLAVKRGFSVRENFGFIAKNPIKYRF